MKGKMSNLSKLFSALFVSALVLSSCAESDESKFRDAEEATKNVTDEASKVKSTPKNNMRGKTETEVFDGPTTTFTVNEEVHDFGIVEKGSSNNFTFLITNTGDAPLIIEKAKASCGCTVPKKPEDPIMPGKTGELEVTFKPKPNQTNVTKNVTVTANTDPRDTILKIKATVQQDETEETSAK